MTDEVDQIVGIAEQHILSFVDEGARRVRVNFSSGAITYKGTDGEDHTLSGRQVLGDKYGLVLKVREAARKFALFRISSEPGFQSNRPLDCPSPLSKTTTAWQNSHGLPASPKEIKELQTFLTNHGHQGLAAAAEKKENKAIAFYTTFKKELEDTRDRLKAELDALGADERTAKRTKREQMAQLKKLIDQLENLDKKAVRWNVAFADDTHLPLTLEQQLTRADLIQDAMASHLKTQKTYFDFRSPIGNPDDSAIRAYSGDAGDLFVPGRWDYEERTRDSNRPQKRHCMEQFIVQNIVRLADPTLNPSTNAEEFGSLISAVGFESGLGMRKILTDATEKARAAAKAV
jgi:hypothetical protein